MQDNRRQSKTISITARLEQEFAAYRILVSVLRCHMAAFEHLGGVPEEILYDRMKTVVLGEAQEEPQHIVYNAKLVALAKHYGFSLPCRTEERPALVDTSSFR